MNRRTFFRALPLIPTALVLSPRRAAAMDITKMQAVATAITGAGFDAAITKQPDGSWRVRAHSANLDIDVAAAHGLATAQAVTGLISEIEYR